MVNFELGGSCQEGGQRLSLLPVQSTPRHHYPHPPICENKGFGLGGSTPNRKVPSWDPEGGFKLIWVRLSFIFPTGLSFSGDQNLYPPVLTAGIEGSNQNARGLRNAHHTQLCRCAGLERNAATNVEPLLDFGTQTLQQIHYNWYNDVLRPIETHTVLVLWVKYYHVF